MGLFFALIIGGLVGGVSGALMRDKNIDFVVIDAFVGVIGSIVALGIYLLTVTSEAPLFFSWGAVLFEVIGALLTTMLFCVVHKKTSDKVSFDTTDSE